VFCGDGVVSGIETCDIGERAQSGGCKNCQVLKNAWTCKSSPGYAPVDIDNPFYIPNLPLLFARDAQVRIVVVYLLYIYIYIYCLFVCLIDLSDLFVCFSLSLFELTLQYTNGLCYGPAQGDDPVFDFGAYQYFGASTACVWTLFADAGGLGQFVLSHANGLLHANPTTGQVYPDASMIPCIIFFMIVAKILGNNFNDPCNMFVLERSKTGYGFVFHPVCALHLAIGVGANFSGSSMHFFFHFIIFFTHSVECGSGNCFQATLVAASQTSNILYVTVSVGKVYPDQTGTVCTRMLFYLGFTSSILSSVDSQATCGDKYRVIGYEDCDDGNLIPGDGCDANVCVLFYLWSFFVIVFCFRC
jgi:cysteine-rich repeat protein